MSTVTTPRAVPRLAPHTLTVPRTAKPTRTPLDTEVLAGALGRLTEACRPAPGALRVGVGTADLRIVLAAYAETHQAGKVAAGASAETAEQVLARGGNTAVPA